MKLPKASGKEVVEALLRTGAIKAAAARLCFSYYYTYQLPIVIVRWFNTFGPRQADIGYAAVIPQFLCRILQGLSPLVYGASEQRRDYYVYQHNLLGKAVNIGSGSEGKIEKLAEIIIELWEDKKICYWCT